MEMNVQWITEKSKLNKPYEYAAKYSEEKNDKRFKN